MSPSNVLAPLGGNLYLALDAFVEASRRLEKTKTLKPITRSLETALQTAFRKQGKLVLAKLPDFRDRFPIQESLTPKEWLIIFGDVSDETLDLFSEPILEAVKNALQAGSGQLIASMGMDIQFGLANPGMVRYLDEVGGLRIRRINDATRDTIQTILDTAGREGWSYDKTAEAISSRFEEFAIGKPQEHIDSRAHLVAVTETGDAYENAGFLAAGDLQSGGLQMEKQWQTVGDNRVSEECAANEAEGWIGIDEPHLSGDQHPLRFPGCRCDEVYRRKQ